MREPHFRVVFPAASWRSGVLTSTDWGEGSIAIVCGVLLIGDAILLNFCEPFVNPLPVIAILPDLANRPVVVSKGPDIALFKLVVLGVDFVLPAKLVRGFDLGLALFLSGRLLGGDTWLSGGGGVIGGWQACTGPALAPPAVWPMTAVEYNILCLFLLLTGGGGTTGGW